jgi:cellulose synthase/poly-beta-1,6-N-acetylglucosamine synthase-like glycosyltransferase
MIALHKWLKSRAFLYAALALSAGLCWSAALWLQARDWQARPFEKADVLYVVAGARDQDLRVSAATAWLRKTRQQPLVLAGNDRARGGWSSAAQRNITMGEWAVVKLRRSMASLPGGGDAAIEVVPGDFRGTDGEMDALAAFLSRDKAARRVTVVTSAFHVRRAVTDLRRHLGPAYAVSAVAAESSITDYLPWVVAGEALKLARDNLGMANVPLISRTAWFDERDLPIVLVFLMLAYAWLLYPAMLAFLARRRNAAAGCGAASPPPGHVTVLIAAHNEEGQIASRIRNILDGQWSNDRLDIWIGSDGSSDRTAEVAREAGGADGRVHVIGFEQRRGKMAVLRDLVAASAGSAGADDVLILTDANTLFDPGAVVALMVGFSDPAVGGVCGRLVFTQPSGDQAGSGAGDVNRRPGETGYWAWENTLKRNEALLDSCLGANGAIYAIRRELFWTEIPPNTIVDDFVIGMKVREQVKRMVYAGEAVAREPLPPSDRDEWRRRVRIGAGVFQALVMCRRCLLPRYGWFAWMFWSHKVLRWFTPHLLLLLLGMTWWLLAVRISEASGWSVGLAIGGLAHVVLLAAPFGLLAGGRRGAACRALRMGWYFFFIQAAMMAGFLRFCRGGLSGAWERTRR